MMVGFSMGSCTNIGNCDRNRCMFDHVDHVQQPKPEEEQTTDEEEDETIEQDDDGEYEILTPTPRVLITSQEESQSPPPFINAKKIPCCTQQPHKYKDSSRQPPVELETTKRVRNLQGVYGNKKEYVATTGLNNLGNT